MIQFGCPRNNWFLSIYVIMSVIVVGLWSDHPYLMCVLPAQCKCTIHIVCSIVFYTCMISTHTFKKMVTNQTPEVKYFYPKFIFLKKPLYWHKVGIEVSLSYTPHPDCTLTACRTQRVTWSCSDTDHRNSFSTLHTRCVCLRWNVCVVWCVFQPEYYLYQPG